MIIEAVNNTVTPDSLVSIFPVLEAYLHIYSMNLLSSSIIQRATTTDKVMDQVKIIRAKNQVADILNIRNGRFVDLVHDFWSILNVLIW